MNVKNARRYPWRRLKFLRLYLGRVQNPSENEIVHCILFFHFGGTLAQPGQLGARRGAVDSCLADLPNFDDTDERCLQRQEEI